MNKINEIYKKLRDYGYLETINFTRETGIGCNGKYDILLILTNKINTITSQRIKITFWDCCEIKINNINGFLFPTMQIEDISIQQLEGINYNVKESENNMFSFFCKDFDYEPF